MTLADLALDAPAQLTAVDGTDPLMLRLMEMGLVPGAPVSVRKAAPFGGPLQIQVRGYLLSIRRNEARRLKVAPLHGSP
jgi:Fe2+ transport system protein FeoA